MRGRDGGFSSKATVPLDSGPIRKTSFNLNFLKTLVSRYSDSGRESVNRNLGGGGHSCVQYSPMWVLCAMLIHSPGAEHLACF